MTENDFDRTARLWLQDGPSQLADRVLEAALDEIHVTRQRRVMWPARRFPSMGNAIRLAAVAAVLVVAVAGINLFLPGNGGLGGPQVSPTPLPTPRGTIVEGDPVPLQPGTYITADPFLVRITLTVPAGWDGKLGGPYAAYLTRQYGPGEVMFFIFDKVYVDPCAYGKGLLVPSPGPTVDDLATALTAMPGVNATAPTDVTLGGYAGKQFTTTAPASFDGCTVGPDGYSIFQLPLGAIYTMAPDQHDRIWLIDVEGQRMMIVAPEQPDQTPQDKAEVQGILDSIRLAPSDLPTPTP
jgi:hypothetical protein